MKLELVKRPGAGIAGLSQKSLRALLDVVEMLEQLPPGRYRALFSVMKFRQPRGVERIDGLVQRAFDITILRPRHRPRLSGRARPALPPDEP